MSTANALERLQRIKDARNGYITDQTGTIMLRVAKNGPLDMVIRPMIKDGVLMSNDALDEAFGRKEGIALLNLINKWFDNVNLISHRDVEGTLVREMTYTDVSPKRVIPVSSRQPGSTTIVQQTTPQATEPTELGDDPVVWPDTPPQLQSKPYFVQPSWYSIMRIMVQAGRHIRLMGPPSVGKDTAIKELAIEQGKPLVTLNGSSLRERHMTGVRAQDASGRSYFLPSQFASAIVHGWYGSITEVNAADQDVLLFLNSITEEPYTITLNGKMYPVHPDFRLFISYNPGALGTRPIPSSFADRFFPIRLSFHTPQMLRQILEANGMPESGLIRDYDASSHKDWTVCLIDYVMALWQRHEDGKLQYQITVRRALDVGTLMLSGMAEQGVAGFKLACRAAIVDAIDNPLNQKEANRILNDLMY